MPASAYSVGRDITLTIFTTAGTIATATLKDFSAKRQSAKTHQVLITGKRLSAVLPEGWDLSMTFARADASLDDYFAAVEAGYYAGQALPNASVTETITEKDGTISQYRYTDVALDFDDTGTWSGNKEVDQKLMGYASARIKDI